MPTPPLPDATAMILATPGIARVSGARRCAWPPAARRRRRAGALGGQRHQRRGDAGKRLEPRLGGGAHALQLARPRRRDADGDEDLAVADRHAVDRARLVERRFAVRPRHGGERGENVVFAEHDAVRPSGSRRLAARPSHFRPCDGPIRARRASDAAFNALTTLRIPARQARSAAPNPVTRILARTSSSPRCRAAKLLRARLSLATPALLPELRLYRAGPASGLSRLASGAGAPYWAYPWGGGLALARYLLDHPETVAQKRVLDLGAGGGVVAIAAMKAGAREAIAIDVDPDAIDAIALNAEANAVTVAALCGDPLDGPAPAVDLVLVGDLFYEAGLAARADRVSRPLPPGRNRRAGRRPGTRAFAARAARTSRRISARRFRRRARRGGDGERRLRLRLRRELSWPT